MQCCAGTHSGRLISAWANLVGAAQQPIKGPVDRRFEDWSCLNWQSLLVYCLGVLCCCRQLQAGARVLDIRLAINPWIAVQARAQHASALKSLLSHRDSTTSIPVTAPSVTSSSTLFVRLRAAVQSAVAAARKAMLLSTQQQADLSAQPGMQQAQQQLYQLDHISLEGQVNWQAAGGLLNDEERRGCIVTSHSLPGAPLTTVLRDIRRFLTENPGEVHWVQL